MTKPKSSYLKTLMTTASVATIVMTANNSLALGPTVRVANQAVARTDMAVGWTVAQVPVSGDTLQYGIAGATILMQDGKALSVIPGEGDTFSTDITLHSGTLTTGDDGTYTITSNNAGNTGNTMTVRPNNGGTINMPDFKGSAIFDGEGTLNMQGNTLTGDVDFANQNGTLELGANGKVTGKVDSTNGANGTIKISGDTAIVNGNIGDTSEVNLNFDGDFGFLFGGDFANFNNVTSKSDGEGKITFVKAGNVALGIVASANRLEEITWQDNQTLSVAGDIYAVDLKGIGADSKLKVAEDTTIRAKVSNAATTIEDDKTLTLGDGTIYTSTIDASNGATSDLKIEGTVNIKAAVGHTEKLDNISIEDASSLTTDANGTLNANNLVLAGSGSLTTGAEVTATTISIGSGAFTAGADVNGEITFTDAGTFDIAGNTHTGDIQVAGNEAKIIINGGTIDGGIDNNGNNLAFIEVGNNGGTVTGIIGQTNKLRIDFGANDSELKIGGAANLFETKNENNKGTINFTGAIVHVLQGNVGSNAAYLKEIKWEDGQKLVIGWGKLYVNNLNGGAGSTINIDNNSEIYGTVGANAATTINNGKTLTFGGEYNSTIDAANAGNGLLVIAQDATLNEAVGNANSLNTITINDEKTLTANSSLKATNLTLDVGGKLISTSTIESDTISIGSGTLTAGGKISGIGGATASIKFTHNLGSLRLGAHELVGNVDFNGKTSYIIVSGGKITGKIDDSIGAGNGTLRLEGDEQVTDKIGETNPIILDFAGDHTLTLDGDLLNLFSVYNVNKNEGKIVTTHNSTFKGMIGTEANPLNKITLGGDLVLSSAQVYALAIDDNTRTISVAENSLISADTVQNITINNTKTLTLVSGTHKGTINGAAANNGSLVIDGGVTLDGVVGAVQKLNAITVNDGKTLTATAEINTDNLTLAGAGNVTTGAAVTATTISIGSGTFIAGADVNGAVLFTSIGKLDMHNNTLTGNVDFAGNNGAITIEDATKLAGNITTTADNTGIVTIGKGDLQHALGAVGLRLNSLTVATIDDSSSNGKDVYAKTLNVGNGAGKRFTIDNGATIDITNVVIRNTDTLELNKAGGISGSITGANGILDLGIDPSTNTATINVGTVNYNLAGNINKNTSVKIAKFNENITLGNAATFTIGNSAEIIAGKTFEASKGTKVDGAGFVFGAGSYSAKNGGDLPKIGDVTHKLGTLSLAGATSYNIDGKYYAANTSVTDATEFKLVNDSEFSGDISFATGTSLSLGAKNLTSPQVTYNDGVTINMDINSESQYGKVTGKNSLAGKSLVLNVTSNVGFEELTELKMFSVVDGEPKITINDTNKLLDLSFKNGSLFVKVDQAAMDDVLEALEEKTTNNDIKEILNMEGNADVIDLQYQIATLSMASEEKAIEAASRVVQNNAQVSNEVISTAISSTMDNIVGRLSSFTSTTLNTTIGVASGDEETAQNSGMWVQGFGSRTSQSKLKGNAGYKATSMGGIVGADTMLNDQLKLGFALAHIDGKIKMKNQKSGDTTNVKSMIASLYGLYSINDNLFTRGMIAVGSSQVEAKERKLKLLGYSTSVGKYSAMNYSLDAAVGYNHSVNNVVLTPEIGLRASLFNDAGYTEKGGAFNRTITKRAGSSYDAVAGVSASTSFANGDAVFTPSLTARVIQNLGGKNPEVSSKINGQSGAGFVSKNKPLNKTMYNLSADLLTNYGMMEYGVSYDANLAKKFVSHSGSFKVRVNF